MYGLTRGTMTLIGVGAAGFLLWLATWIGVDTLGEYWVFAGLCAAGGLVMALSQLFGGWTKWGWPRASLTVFLLGFLPALAAGGLVLLDGQPDPSAWGTGWAESIGLAWLTEDLLAVGPAIAFAIGLVFGLVFDTSGTAVERDREVVEEEDRRGYAGPVPAGAVRTRGEDEPVRAEREEVAETEVRRPETREHAVVGAREERQGDDRVVRERDERPYPERESRFRSLFRR